MIFTTLFFLVACTIATWTTRSPWEVAASATARKAAEAAHQAAQYLTAEQHAHTIHRARPLGQDQQVLQHVDDGQTLTVTSHATEYRVEVVTEYLPEPTTSTTAVPAAAHPTFVPSFYRPDQQCEAEICDQCRDWYRCENGVPDCFICKTAPTSCRCLPPADLIRGAAKWDRTHAPFQTAAA